MEGLEEAIGSTVMISLCVSSLIDQVDRTLRRKVTAACIKRLTVHSLDAMEARSWVRDREMFVRVCPCLSGPDGHGLYGSA